MSFRMMTRQPLEFSTLGLTRSVKKQGSFRLLMRSSALVADASYSRILKKTARKVSIPSARLRYFIGTVGRAK